jgi:hypothetical protein
MKRPDIERGSQRTASEEDLDADDDPNDLWMQAARSARRPIQRGAPVGASSWTHLKSELVSLLLSLGPLVRPEPVERLGSDCTRGARRSVSGRAKPLRCVACMRSCCSALLACAQSSTGQPTGICSPMIPKTSAMSGSER